MQGINIDAGMTALSGSVRIAQSLTVQGDLSVTGVINKVNDLEVKDSIIRVNKYEPPSAAPAVVNGGLEVYRGGTAPNAQIIWDETADVWRIGVESSLDTVVTNGRLSSHNHDGLAGNGGQVSHTSLSNIAPAVVASTDPTANKHVSNLQAKGWQDHVNIVAGNPHGTTAAQVGALAANNYGFARSVAATIAFSASAGNGAIQTVLTNFQTQFIWATGAIYATLGGRQFGTTVSGYADMRNGIQRGNGASIERSAVLPYLFIVPLTYGSLGGATFYDQTALPSRFLENVTVQISAVSATNVTVQLSRGVPFSSTIAYLPITGLSVTLQILCLG